MGGGPSSVSASTCLDTADHVGLASCQDVGQLGLVQEHVGRTSGGSNQRDEPCFSNRLGGATPQAVYIVEQPRDDKSTAKCVLQGASSHLTILITIDGKMIALAAGEATVVLLDVAQGTCSPMACPTNVDESERTSVEKLVIELIISVIQVMATLSQLLAKGGVQDGHYCRETARTLRQHVEHIGMLPH